MENRELEMMDEIVINSEDESETTSSTFDYTPGDIDEVDEDIDNVYTMDYDHCLSEKINNKYYIGSYEITDNRFLLSSSISPSTYFKIDPFICSNYLYFYSLSTNTIKSTDILKVNIVKINGWDICTVTVKTFWLKIIQRKWKKIYKERMKIIKNRKNVTSLHQREINGKFPSNCKHLPSLQGLLVY